VEIKWSRTAMNDLERGELVGLGLVIKARTREEGLIMGAERAAKSP